MKIKKLNGWMTSGKEGLSCAHFFINGKAACGEKLGKNYIEIDVKNFPEKKYCKICKPEIRR